MLFVCLGNICRSPTGEAVFAHWVAQQGLRDQIKIDSAGTIGYHAGHPADARMRKHAARRGYELLSRSRKVTAQDLQTFDLIVAMDRSNYEDLQGVGPVRGRLTLLGALMPEDWPGDENPDVPDPYYGGAEGFEEVLDMIEAACPRLLEALMATRRDGGQ